MRWASIISLLALGLGLTNLGVANAQQRLEENAPELRTGQQLTQLPGSNVLDPSKASDAWLGPKLSGIVLLDQPGEVLSITFVPGIDGSSIKPPAGVDFEKILSPFLGQPLSLRLIAKIRISIVGAYREAGFDFVAVIVPAQEVSSGSLQILVNQFRLAEKRVEGAVWTPNDYILGHIRSEKGNPINSKRLLEDLNWLNLNPYRNLIVVAEPGKQFGETNLVFRAEEKKPWTVFGGINNYGTSSTDERRMFVGFGLANIPMVDHQLNYKLTMNPEAFSHFDQNKIDTMDQAAYLSHDGFYFVPLPWRHKFKLRGAYIKSRSNLVTPLVSESESYIVSGEYMIPVTTFAGIQSELYARGTYKRSERDTFSSGSFLSAAAIDIAQGAIGVRGIQQDRFGRSSFDWRVVHSPGGVTNANNDAAFAAFSGNPNAQADYTYFYGAIRRSTKLPKGLSLHSNLAGQYASNALPSTELFSLGGNDTLRGYETSEVSADSGVSSQLELHAPIHDYLTGKPASLDYLDAYVFSDSGYAYNRLANVSQTLSSVGVGLNMGLFNKMTVNSNLGVVLRDAGTTGSKRGDIKSYFGMSARF